MVDVIARCGFICNQCPAYDGNIKSDADKEKVADKWLEYYGFRINAEDVVCDGCMKADSENPRRITKDCTIRNCVLRKKIENCAYCDEYPCDLMKTRIADIEQIKAMYERKISADEYAEFFRPYDARMTFERIKTSLKNTHDA